MHSPDPRWFARLVGRRPARPAPEELHVCVSCGADYVNPVEWEAVTPEAWWMRLRCGECGIWRDVTVTNAVAEQFDLELDRRAASIHRTLAKLDREQMVKQVETIIGALEYDLIEPGDFARS